MQTLGISKDEFANFDSEIYSNFMKRDPKKVLEGYDIIILDEYHRCGAKKWGIPIREDNPYNSYNRRKNGYGPYYPYHKLF